MRCSVKSANERNPRRMLHVSYRTAALLRLHFVPDDLYMGVAVIAFIAIGLTVIAYCCWGWAWPKAGWREIRTSALPRHRSGTRRT